jgi:hypothetical protein
MRPLPVGPAGRRPLRGEGTLIRPALDLMGALKLGIQIGLDEIRADEFIAMLIVAEERDLLEREKSPEWRGSGPT